MFSGTGVFSTEPHAKGEVLCYFRGGLVPDGQAMGAAEQRYMIQGPSGVVNSPVQPGQTGPPKNLPGILAGALINEASHTGGRHFPANAMVAERLSPSALNSQCPWYSKSSDWPVYALRDIRAGEEILICYGDGYGRRDYIPSGTCNVR